MEGLETSRVEEWQSPSRAVGSRGWSERSDKICDQSKVEENVHHWKCKGLNSTAETRGRRWSNALILPRLLSRLTVHGTSSPSPSRAPVTVEERKEVSTRVLMS
ncbi:hypothetical protein EYF80_039643 [Liparis tanakae]|uniref:Uncharacterized protein n=1 Tax=Liparis tanakae TaxID=230148 RepID=A0A4Z2GBQ8_9TELE|nr:hypothetical protein EYF80_039643 [Liparis tanakae]